MWHDLLVDRCPRNSARLMLLLRRFSRSEVKVGIICRLMRYFCTKRRDFSENFHKYSSCCGQRETHFFVRRRYADLQCDLLLRVTAGHRVDGVTLSSGLFVRCDVRVKDVYIITSMTIVIMVCVWHAIVPAIYFAWGSAVADTCDIAVAAALGTAYVIAHILFAFVIATRVRK